MHCKVQNSTLLKKVQVGFVHCVCLYARQQPASGICSVELTLNALGFTRVTPMLSRCHICCYGVFAIGSSTRSMCLHWQYPSVFYVHPKVVLLMLSSKLCMVSGAVRMCVQCIQGQLLCQTAQYYCRLLYKAWSKNICTVTCTCAVGKCSHVDLHHVNTPT